MYPDYHGLIEHAELIELASGITIVLPVLPANTAIAREEAHLIPVPAPKSLKRRRSHEEDQAQLPKQKAFSVDNASRMVLETISVNSSSLKCPNYKPKSMHFAPITKAGEVVYGSEQLGDVPQMDQQSVGQSLYSKQETESAVEEKENQENGEANATLQDRHVF